MRRAPPIHRFALPKTNNSVTFHSGRINLRLIPPYEHYNATISSWARQLGLQVINYTPGTLTNGDYTTPEMKRYFSSKEILGRIWEYERTDPNGLNGHIMLIHFGTDPARTDKFYDKLPGLIRELRRKGYSFTPLKDNDQAHL